MGPIKCKVDMNQARLNRQRKFKQKMEKKERRMKDLNEHKRVGQEKVTENLERLKAACEENVRVTMLHHDAQKERVEEIIKKNKRLCRG